MMLRPVYIIGSLFLALAAASLIAHSRAQPRLAHTGVGLAVAADPSDAAAWFRRIKPYCNSVEVEAWHRWSPPPGTDKGAAYSAACYALAGKIERARQLILTVPQPDSWRAAGVVFEVAHPIADAGDDESAGPIMELVVEFWPNHYMALYHAGISRYELGDHPQARAHLQDFLSYYDTNDGWRRNALKVLEDLEEN